jgi:hypothetical protein
MLVNAYVFANRHFYLFFFRPFYLFQNGLLLHKMTLKPTQLHLPTSGLKNPGAELAKADAKEISGPNPRQLIEVSFLYFQIS